MLLETTSSNIIDNRFGFLIFVASGLGPAYAMAAGSIKPVLFAFCMSCLTCITSVISMVIGGHPKYGFCARFFQILSMALAMPSFFAGTGPVIRANHRTLRDNILLTIDSKLFGSLFPDGQMALAIDTHPWIGPDTFIGKALVELFTLFYFSYYVWGYLLLALMFLQYFLCWKNNSINSEKLWWIKIKMFMCTWLGTFIMNFTLNLMVPALSPRLYIAERFIHPLDGFGLAGAFRRIIYAGSAGSYGTFPSGHTSVSWVTGWMGLQFFRGFGHAASFAALMITIATVYLRYHYVVDLLGAIPVIFIGLFFGGFIPRSTFELITHQKKKSTPSGRVGV